MGSGHGPARRELATARNRSRAEVPQSGRWRTSAISLKQSSAAWTSMLGLNGQRLPARMLKLAGSAHRASHLGQPAPTPCQAPYQPLLRAANASRSGGPLPCVRTPRWPGRRGPPPPTLPWRPLRGPCHCFWRCRSRAASHCHPASSRTPWTSPLSPRPLRAPARATSRKFRHE